MNNTLLVALCGGLGVLSALAYLAWLWKSVAAVSTNADPVRAALKGTVLRLTLLLVCLAGLIAVGVGGLPLLALGTSFLCTRFLVVKTLAHRIDGGA